MKESLATRRKKRKINSATAVNSRLVRRPIRRMWWLFLAPTVVSFVIGFVWPFLQGIGLSFCRFTTVSDASLFTKAGKLVGFSNYVKAFQDASFFHAFWYTALFAVVSLLIINLLAFAVAYALTSGIKGSNIFRTVFFMPNLIGGIVLGYIWDMIFNGILIRYGQTILDKTEYGFWGLLILMCWQQVGYMMIIYIAGLQAIPEELNEAARIDGAGKWQQLIHVTIPNVMSSITICAFLTLSNGFKLFDQNLALTGGAPFVSTKTEDGLLETVRTTEMLALNIYQTFYNQNQSARGIAQAKGVIFFVLVAVISLVQLRATRSKEVQQ